jgi:hypothetical protein
MIPRRELWAGPPIGSQSSSDAQTARTIQWWGVRGRIDAMVAHEERGWTEKLPSVQREEVKNSSLSAVQLIYFSLGLGQI